MSRHIQSDQPEHDIDLEDTKILATEARWFKRGVKEAVFIRQHRSSLNHDGARFNLSQVWTNLLKDEGDQLVTL